MGDEIYAEWENDERVAIIHFLNDIGQPYSCLQWGNLGTSDIPPIVGDDIGDVSDWFEVKPAMAGIDAVFHLAASKHVGLAETYSRECIKTNVMEKGVSLSGGEKQRLALARGLLAARNSDIILMDEPTSSVDSVNEVKIHDNIFKEFKDKTIISSIHRLNLLNKFDYIYMFDDGKIVAEGTLDELMKNNKFKVMWQKHRGKK